MPPPLGMRAAANALTRRLTMTNTPSTHSTGAPALDSTPLLDAERLQVYNVALEFQTLASALAMRTDAVVRDQLRRASLSCVLNIAEGAGRRSRAQKRHFYSIGADRPDAHEAGPEPLVSSAPACLW